MDEHNSVHLADASLDMIFSHQFSALHAIEKTLSDGALVAGIAKMPCPKLLASFLGLTTKFENSS